MFCIVGDDVVFGIVVGVRLVSIIDEIVRVFPTNAEQTCGQSKMRHFSGKHDMFTLGQSSKSMFMGCCRVFPQTKHDFAKSYCSLVGSDIFSLSQSSKSMFQGFPTVFSMSSSHHLFVYPNNGYMIMKSRAVDLSC